MSEAQAWMGAIFFGALAVLTTLGLLYLLLVIGFAHAVLFGLNIALYFISGGLFTQAFYMRAQRVLTARADALEEDEKRE